MASSACCLQSLRGEPRVIRNSATDYEMWYTHAQKDLSISDIVDVVKALNLDNLVSDIANLDLAQFLSHLSDLAADVSAVEDLLDGISTVIGYATSTNGINWTVEDFPVLAGSGAAWDSVGAPCVIKESDTSYKMWYTRAKTSLTQANLQTILNNIASTNTTTRKNAILDLLDSTSSVIGYATSDNGASWTVQNSEVLPGSSSSVWDSVADPCVIKNSDTDYEMWYTNVKTNLVEANLHTLASVIDGWDIAGLWTTLKDEGIADFITALVALDIDTIKSVLSDTSTVIGYATSSDGVNWAVRNSQHLIGSSITPWSGVAAPSVVKTGSRYEMWYTEGIGELTWQNLLDLILGDNLPIGYAYYTPPAPSPPPPPPPLTVETNLFGIEGSFPISDEGVIEEEIVAISEDENVTVTVEEGTIALDIEGEPLETLEAAVDPSPPEPPEGAYLIGAYDFGPDGATFDPPMTLTWSYDPETLPEGVDLVIAYYDEVNEEWVWVPCEVDTENNIITASVAHFTTFAIIAVPAELPLPPPPPAPAAFSVSYLSVSQLEVEPGETVTITVLVANTGGESGSYTVVLKIDGVKEAEETVTIAAGESQAVSFSVTKEEAGSYSVDVSGLTGSFTVQEEVVPPVVPPVPAAFAISNLSISPAEVDIGGSVTISVLIANTGDLTGSYEVTLKIDNVVVATKEVTLAGGASQKVTFTTTKDVAGTYTVNVNGQSDTFMVKEKVVPLVAPKPIAWWVWLIIGLVSAVVVGFAVWMVVRRRRA